MLLRDLFEYKDLDADTYHKQQFDKVFPFVQELMNSGQSFYDALDGAKMQFGEHIVKVLFMNLKQELGESDQINEYKMDDLRTMSDEKLIDLFNEAHPVLVPKIREELVRRGHTEYADQSIQFEEIEEAYPSKWLTGKPNASKKMFTNNEFPGEYKQKAKEFANQMREEGRNPKFLTNFEAGHVTVLYNEDLEEGMAWAKSGNKVVRKFRCTGGPRHGRVVSKPAQCFAPPDMKKRIRLKITKAKQGKKMTRKAKKTKRTSAVSKRVKAMNK